MQEIIISSTFFSIMSKDEILIIEYIKERLNRDKQLNFIMQYFKIIAHYIIDINLSIQ